MTVQFNISQIGQAAGEIASAGFFKQAVDAVEGKNAKVSLKQTEKDKNGYTRTTELAFEGSNETKTPLISFNSQPSQQAATTITIEGNTSGSAATSSPSSGTTPVSFNLSSSGSSSSGSSQRDAGTKNLFSFTVNA